MLKATPNICQISQIGKSVYWVKWEKRIVFEKTFQVSRVQVQHFTSCPPNGCFNSKMNLSIIRFIFCLRELQEPGQGVLDPKVDWVDQQVGEEEEEVCTTKAGQEMVEDVPHRPVKFFFFSKLH